MPTTTQAAAILGCGRSTVQRLCRAHRIGQRESVGVILTLADVERLRPLVRPAGNPGIAGLSARGVAARQKARKRAKKA